MADSGEIKPSHIQNTDENQNEDQEDQEDQETEKSRRDAELKSHGQWLYGSMHFLFLTGFYRTLPVKDFKWMIAFGYAIEWIFSFLPMFMLQMINNS